MNDKKRNEIDDGINALLALRHACQEKGIQVTDVMGVNKPARFVPGVTLFVEVEVPFAATPHAPGTDETPS